MNEKKIIINNNPLSDEQLRPIIDNPHLSMIVAGAGAGKTFLLLGKIKYLLDNAYFKPQDICCISFTNEAVTNLQKQIIHNCHVNIDCFTFHKLALNILNQTNFEYEIAPPNFLNQTITSFFSQKQYLKNAHITKCLYSYFHLIGPFKKWRLQNQNFKALTTLINHFLTLFFSNNYQKNDFKTFFTTQTNSPLLFIIYAIYLTYEKNKCLYNYLDFDNLITYATKSIQHHQSHLSYKCLIIDEWQDTSLARFNLIKALQKENNCSLCVVGDDWQSIYRFSGSDISLFLNFQHYFPKSRIYKLQTTYRSSQQLITIAQNFILKNTNQITKNMISPLNYSKPLKLVYYYNAKTILSKVIKRINSHNQIFILGRNNYDINNYNINLKAFKNIRYLTIHASKGLEAEYVILLNVANDIHGIPTKIKDTPLFNLVKQPDNYLYEEERRLFYVALTRAKKEVYLLIPKANPSTFINELKKENEVEIIHL